MPGSNLGPQVLGSSLYCCKTLHPQCSSHSCPHTPTFISHRDFRYIHRSIWSISLLSLCSTGPYSNLALLGLYNHIILASYSGGGLPPPRYATGDLRSCSKLLTERQKDDFCQPGTLQHFHGNREAFRERFPFNECVWNPPDFKRAHGWARNSRASRNGERVFT